MVLLGGLELVAAGYVLNEFTKDNKKDKSPRRRRSSDRKHDHRYDSHNSHHQQSHSQQGLRPPQQGPPRPSSQPPPQSRPAYHPPQPPVQGPAPQAYHPPHPPVQGPAPHWQQPPPPYYQGPPPMQGPPRPNTLPPPNMHFNMKTGKWQNNMYPADMQPQARDPSPMARSQSQSQSHSRSQPQFEKGQYELHRSQSDLEPPRSRQPTQQPHQYVSDDHHERLRGESDFYASEPRSSSTSNPAYGAQQHNHSQPQMHSVSSPRAGYAEMDAETPGRYRPYDMKASPPPSYRE